jgi:hypothetical protein
MMAKEAGEFGARFFFGLWVEHANRRVELVKCKADELALNRWGRSCRWRANRRSCGLRSWSRRRLGWGITHSQAF